ncbi:unnamed protein product [Symbiodinium sp. CCMP2456]|nr:unnamed protein product [Symbiodinium sp. CCMP2456]
MEVSLGDSKPRCSQRMINGSSCEGMREPWALAVAKDNLDRKDVISFSLAISTCERRGSWQRAVELLAGMPPADVRPDVISFNSTTSACGKGRQWQISVGLQADMRRTKLAVDVIGFNTCASACGAAGQWQAAVCNSHALSARRLEPDTRTLNAALSALEKAGEWQQGLSMASQMRRQHLQASVVTFNTSIATLRQRWDAGIELLWQMSAFGVDPNVISWNAGMSCQIDLLAPLFSQAQRPMSPGLQEGQAQAHGLLDERTVSARAHCRADPDASDRITSGEEVTVAHAEARHAPAETLRGPSELAKLK